MTQKTSAAEAYRRVVGNCRSFRSAERRHRRSVVQKNFAPIVDATARGNLWGRSRRATFFRYSSNFSMRDRCQRFRCIRLKMLPAELGGEPKSENLVHVAAANPNAEILLGFREPITRDSCEQRLRRGTVIDHVHRIAVQTGDAVNLPAGRVDAVSAQADVLIEIEQNGDASCRVFD